MKRNKLFYYTHAAAISYTAKIFGSLNFVSEGVAIYDREAAQSSHYTCTQGLYLLVYF